MSESFFQDKIAEAAQPLVQVPPPAPAPAKDEPSLGAALRDKQTECFFNEFNGC